MHPQHRARRQVDEILLEDLRNEGETPRCAQVAFDDLDVGIRRQELDVEGAGDVQFRGDLGRNLADAGRRHAVNLLRRELHRGVAGMDAGKLHVLGNRIGKQLAPVGHGVELDLLAALHKGTDDHRMLLAHFDGQFEEFFQVFAAVADIHRGAGKHVGRPHQHREAHFVDEGINLVHIDELAPARLVDAEFVHNRRELVAVFGAVDIDGGGAEQLHALLHQGQREVVGNLAAHAHDDAVRLLERADFQHALQAQFVEEEPVADVVIGGDGFRIVIDHNGLEAVLFQRFDGAYGAPVELYAAADAVGTGTKHDHAAVPLAGRHGMAGTVVTEVQVVRKCGVRRCVRADFLDAGPDAHRLPGAAHFFFAHAQDPGNLDIGKALALAFVHQGLVQRLETAAGLQFAVGLH